uniref:Ycf54 n=1 Tax=Cyanidium sp. THAL103 TaxID=3027999 RepID=A0A9Y1MXX1_9RHOD|nr:hypothetical protein CspTHAL103_118 [Cyanidium sp. THAL103]
MILIYYFLIGSKQFLFYEEPLEEILRERVTYYLTNSIPIDFWILNPDDLKSVNVIDQGLSFINKPALLIISKDKNFITWLNLRLQYVFTGELKTNLLI